MYNRGGGMKKTALYPYEHSSNPYIGMIKTAIESNGYEVVPMKSLFGSHSLAKEVQVITLNWFDAVPDYPMPKLLPYLVRNIARIYYFKANHIKIIHTFHNMLPHDTKHPVLSSYIIKFMCNHADRVAVLCDYSKTALKLYMTDEDIAQKVRVVYHPTYDGIYPTSEVNIPELSSDSNKMHILFVGNIRPYKNIEMILKIAEDYKEKDVEFTIAGKPISEEYATQIRKLGVKAGNVNLIPRFIKDEEMTSLYQWADIVFLPLSEKSSLNSGSAMLSITFKKTLVATLVGTLMDFPQDSMFTYRYDNEEEHYQAASVAFERAFQTWQSNHSNLRDMGEQLYLYAQKKFSLPEVAKRYGLIYSELEN